MINRCKKCLVREMADNDVDIEKYKAAIRESDRVTEDEYEKRLDICRKCDSLNAGTCFSCGCYVEIRAFGKSGHCPHKKW